MERSSCPAGRRPGDALQEAARLERSRGDDESVWTWWTCCALSDAGSSGASHPPERNRHPARSSAGESGSSAPGDHQHFESLHVLAGREVSARSSRSPLSSLHHRSLRPRWDDGERGGSGDLAERYWSAQTCG